MNTAPPLARIEAVLDAADINVALELALPVGGRPRQLRVRTLFIGMLLAAADGRPGHLVRVHRALVGLNPDDQRRLGVVIDWRHGPHLLTYRQVERTFSLVVRVLANADNDGSPSEALARVVDALMEASVPEAYKHATSLAVDWTDHQTWALGPHSDGVTADTDASWGRRHGPALGPKDEVFFGYYPQAATMVADEGGAPVPELTRRMLVTSCHLDPPRAFVNVLARMVGAGIALGDVLADSGYAHRDATGWALPVRALGGRLIQDLHPSDRGPKGTHAGAVVANGNLWCPCTPVPLLDIAPLARHASAADTATHDGACHEAARYKLGRQSADDADGYHRVGCPALAGKIRCPLRPDSMSLPLDRPEILNPPTHPPRCCTQRTITVPPSVNAKTTQKHDYPSPSHRRSYARRSAAERTFSTVKDSASTNTTRGWCRLMGLVPITLFLACAFIVRNQRVHDAFETRQADDARRLRKGQLPTTRRRRRRSIDDLIANAPP